MKKTRYILVLLIISLLIPGGVSAAASNRVIYTFNQLTDNSGKISLDWKTPSDQQIQIISYYLNEDQVMEVTYRVGSNIPAGFNDMTILSPKVPFPIPIILKEQQVEEDWLSDLPDDREKQIDVLTLYNQGIINGYDDGTFRPNKSVIRAEFFAMLVAAVGYSVDDSVPSAFDDVAENYWGKKYIMALAQKGIVNGSGDGKCNPLGDVTIGQVLALIDRTFVLFDDSHSYLEPTGAHWSNESYIHVAKAGILRESDNFIGPYEPNMKATRQQCATLISRVLQTGHSIR